MRTWIPLSYPYTEYKAAASSYWLSLVQHKDLRQGETASMAGSKDKSIPGIPTKIDFHLFAQHKVNGRKQVGVTSQLVSFKFDD